MKPTPSTPVVLNPLPASIRTSGAAAAARWLGLAAALALALGASACATVRPEQRQLLADPVMQFKAGERDQRAKDHVLEYREGAIGGGSVKGGGCGCN
jgi:hypothetical protein